MAREHDKVTYKFGEFSLDTGRRVLLRGTDRVPLSPKEFDALVLLAESGGEAVGRERLMQSIWPDTFVADTSLARNISVLRKYLGTGAIETVPKFGYRFALAVTVALPDESGADVQPRTGEPPSLAYTAREYVVGAETRSKEARDRSSPVVSASVLVSVIVVGAIAIAALLSAPRTQPGTTLNPTVPTLAVLPFENRSNDPRQSDYLRDGLAEELTGRLSRLNYNRLRVLARASTRQYLNTTEKPLAVAAELNARYLLDGTVLFSGSQAHLTVELIDGPAQTIVWSREFVRPVADLSAVQDEVVERVVQTTGVEMGREIGTTQLPGETTSPEARDAYLQARYALEQKTLFSERQALEKFRLAARLDPNYARAYQGISETYIFMPVPIHEENRLAQARDAALKAIRLNEQLAEAHRDLAWTLFNEDRDLDGADREYRRALELNPNDARAHHWYAQLLAAEKRGGESLREATTGYQLDPRSIGSGYNYAFMLIEAGLMQAGIRVLEDLLKREPDRDVIWGYLGIGYARLSEFDKSARAYQRAAALDPVDAGYQAASAYAFAMEGDTDEAKSIIRDEERKYASGIHVPGAAMAEAYLGIGDKEKAIMWLKRGEEDRSFTLFEAETEPIYSALADDLRFKEIVADLRKPR